MTRFLKMHATALALLLGAARVLAEPAAMAGKKLAIGGYCPVAYVKMQGSEGRRPLQLGAGREGVPVLGARGEGTYLFSSTEAKAAFDKDPGMTIAKADQNWPNPT